MWRNKWSFKSNIRQKYQHGIHLPKPLTDDQSHEDVAHIAKDETEHDLEFESALFGTIKIKEIRAQTKNKFIQLFFEDLDKANDVIVTVRDIEHPAIEERTVMKLEFETYYRKISARLFRAILPYPVKQPYIKKHSDHYQRLQHLLWDIHKDVVLEER